MPSLVWVMGFWVLRDLGVQRRIVKLHAKRRSTEKTDINACVLAKRGDCQDVEVRCMIQ